MPIFQWWRRRTAKQAPFREEWREILRREVPFYRAFDEAERARFEDNFKLFILTKYFIEAGGFVMTEEAKVLISAAAARLVMNLPEESYARLTEVVVYPSHYRRPNDEEGTIILGEAHRWGTVVLSYSAVLSGIKNPTDGHETATHEFAHVLDGEDGSFDGTPLLDRSAYAPWTQAMSRAFLRLRSQVEHHRKPEVLREYGATNEAEFFAVATEAFFERSKKLKEKHPELYAVLRDYYRTDPAA